MQSEGNKNAVKWLFKVPGRKKIYIVLLIIVQALNGGSGVLYAILLRNIVDSAVAHNRDLFWENVIFAVMLVAFQIAIRSVLRVLGEYSRAVFENLFKGRLMEQLLTKDYSRISAVHSGEWQTRLTNDTVVVANSYVDVIPGLIGMIVKLISAIVMIFLLDRRLALMLIPVGIVFLIFTYLFRKQLKKLHKKVQEADGRLRVFLQERISSMMMIRSFGAEAQTGRQAAEKMEDHKNARMTKIRFSNFCNIGFGTAMNGLYLFGTCYCGYGILTGTIGFGTLTAITQLITQIQMPVNNITGFLPQYYAMIASAERLMEIESFETDDVSEVMNPDEIKEFYRNKLERICLENAGYTYYSPSESLNAVSKEEMPMAVKDVSISLKKGEYVAFVGYSGCGKSTVLKLMMCVFKPETGRCYAVTKDGEELPLDDRYRKLFAYVPQGNQLLSGSIREVVCFADSDDLQNEERFRNALHIACADEFVSELEQGADTVLGERGMGLSEGQMQRLSIARAIFSDCPILLLDEATSALDEVTEKKVLKNLRELTDRTVVIITHREEALKICDRVVHFTEKGTVDQN